MHDEFPKSEFTQKKKKFKTNKYYHDEFPKSEFTKKFSVKSNRILFNVLGLPLHRGCGDLILPHKRVPSRF